MNKIEKATAAGLVGLTTFGAALGFENKGAISFHGNSSRQIEMLNGEIVELVSSSPPIPPETQTKLVENKARIESIKNELKNDPRSAGLEGFGIAVAIFTPLAVALEASRRWIVREGDKRYPNSAIPKRS